MRLMYPLLEIETTIVSSVTRSSILKSPISSPLISVRRSSAYFRLSSFRSSRMSSRTFFWSERCG